jgi:hypothetical protein
MRLIEIEPAENSNDTPSCKLIHVTFAEKPQYEALSYTWGDQTVKEAIFVDGKEFLVGQNLWDALYFLRKRANGRRYWIDAICINQTDIPERNRQLRIMPHIYMRAHMVLVWLGRKYTKYESGRSRTPTIEYVARHAGDGLPHPMGEELYSDEYWDRVWIVQEIGKARKIQVCVGEGEVAWDDFIKMVEKFAQSWRRVVQSKDYNNEGGLFNLERQLQEKYARGHTLRELLENHQNSVCKDPRDKIYGFVGLAADARGFPMDYQKSLWEVWKDTMLFANRHSMISRFNIFHFGRLVKSLLGGSNMATRDQVAQGYASWTASHDDQDSSTVFYLSAYVAGMILCVGPSPEQIISVLDAEDEWRERIQQNFPADLGDAYRDNDLLMQVILDSEADDSEVLHFPNPYVRWKSNPTLGSIIDDCKKKGNNVKQQEARDLSVPQESGAHGLENTQALLPTSKSCLYQIKRLNGQKSSWKMGIAVGEAQTGDLICWVPEVEKAVIVRIIDTWARIVGTAVFPKDLPGRVVAGLSSTYFDPDEEAELGVDVETVYLLISKWLSLRSA